MRPNNPAVYECPRGKNGIHHWVLKAKSGTAACFRCKTLLTKEQAEEVFFDYDQNNSLMHDAVVVDDSSAQGEHMTDPVTTFKQTVLASKPGDVIVYHTGHLANGIACSPSLTNIQMIARGLHLMGRVSLRQRKVKNVIESLNGESLANATEYSFKVLQRINALDFETARKAHLEDVA